MKIFDNPKLIKRNIFLTKSTLIASLAILGMGFFLSISSNSLRNFYFSLVALALGYIFARINISLSSIWGVTPRQDEIVAMSLKGLGDKFCLFQYKSAVPHLLLGPCGLWVINPINVTGAVGYDSEKDKWTHKKSGGIFSRLLSTESLGDPNQKAEREIRKFSRFIENLKADIPNLPPAQGVNVFLGKNLELGVKNSPIPAIHIDKFKDFIRKNVLTDPYQIRAVQDFSDFLVIRT